MWETFFTVSALAAVMIWPAIPLFWIPVHGLPGIFKKLGMFTYLLPAFIWPPTAWLIYQNRDIILAIRFDYGLPVRSSGFIILAAGMLLQLLTGRFLSIKGLMGMPEITQYRGAGLVVSGPYKLVRHPTYLSHTLMLAGLHMMTGSAAVGIAASLDFLTMNLLVMPLEEKELLERFGEEYAAYMKKVPAYFPRLKPLHRK